MNDLITLVIFLACSLTTFGFVAVCEWLRPRESGRAERASRTGAQELRS